MARTDAELTAAEILQVQELNSAANNTVIYKNNSGVISGMDIVTTIVTTGGTTTLSNTSNALEVSGTLVSNATIIVPNKMVDFIVDNTTTGAFTLTVKTAAGLGVVVAQGTRVILYANGTDVELGASGAVGAGDMVLASVQTNSGLKTFLNGTFGLRNIANTITSFFSSSATVSRTYTLQDRDGTLADNTDLALKANIASPTFTGTVGGITAAMVGAPSGSGTSTGSNTGDVTLAGTPNYLTIVGQVITRALIDLTTHVTGILTSVNGGTGNGFTKFSGPTTTEKTFTLPDTSSTLASKGTLSVNVAGGVDVTLTAAQFSANSAFDLTGLLTANINLIIPDSLPCNFVVDNGSTGAFTITVKHAATAGKVIPQGNKSFFYDNGTTVDFLTSINGLNITPPATSATLAVANLKTFTVNNTLTLAGTDTTTKTFSSRTSSTVADIDDISTFTINTQTGTTYTFVLADGINTLCTFANAAAITVTVPPNSSVAFPIGTQIDCIQDGVGKVTFAAGVGVTINSLGGNKSIAGQYVGVSLIKEATDTWYLIGNLIA